MSENEKIEQEVLDTYRSCWQFWAARDFDGLLSNCSEEITFFGTGSDERGTTLEKWQNQIRRDFTQMDIPVEVEFLSSYVRVSGDIAWVIGEVSINAVSELEDMGIIRLTQVFKRISNKWLMIHYHGSVPYPFQQSGESYQINAIIAKNRELEMLKKRLEAENIYLQDEIKLQHNFGNIITRNEDFKKVLHKVEQVSATDATVLILGETGTGKELLARAIHNISNRSERPLVKVNCSALPVNLIESELFGHEKGSFTGAFFRKIGRFELADGGTIFLDEIGDLPLELQPKILRVLQEGEFERIGNPKTIKVNVRIIAATNRNLSQEIKKGNFREDLYYRLNVFPIYIPPLRERKEDLPLLIKHFVNKFSRKVGKRINSVSQNMINQLTEYNWPGNVRELENIIERAVITNEGNNLILSEVLPKIVPSSMMENEMKTLEETERQYILKVLEKTNWQVSGEYGAAKILGMKRTTLEARMKKLSIKKK